MVVCSTSRLRALADAPALHLDSALEPPALPARLQQEDLALGPAQRQSVARRSRASLAARALTSPLGSPPLPSAKFLSEQGVMDYSVVCAVDQNQSEITAGIIDYIRTFTWDKKVHLERRLAPALARLLRLTLNFLPPCAHTTARELGQGLGLLSEQGRRRADHRRPQAVQERAFRFRRRALEPAAPVADPPLPLDCSASARAWRSTSPSWVASLARSPPACCAPKADAPFTLPRADPRLLDAPRAPRAPGRSRARGLGPDGRADRPQGGALDLKQRPRSILTTIPPLPTPFSPIIFRLASPPPHASTPRPPHARCSHTTHQ